MKKVFNFDHGINQPKEIVIGPFKIIINEDHCKNIERLYQRTTKSFTFTGDFEPVVFENLANHGETVETAWIEELDDPELEHSLLFLEVPWATSYYDLVVILTFLTGRPAYLEEHLNEYASQRYLDGTVSNNFFLLPINFWTNVKKIRDIGVSQALYNLNMTYNMHDLLCMSAHANTALDIITTSWIQTKEKTKFIESKAINRCLDQTVNLLNKSLLTRFQICFLRLLVKEGISDNIIQDIKARISQKNVSSPSALYKLKQFLSEYALYPQPDSDVEEKRIKWLNILRNRVTHSGNILKDPNYDFAKLAQISGAITLLVIQIVQYYLAAEVLKIEDSRLEQCKKNIKAFFSTGQFNGQDVFNENYEDYMARLEDKW